MASGDENDGPVFFWKPEEQTYGGFSQWYDAPFVVDGVKYQTAEMWMMIQKAKLFGDEEIANRMAQVTDPAEHQRLGRQAKGFDKSKWNEHKSRIVEEGNYHKFTKSTEREALLKLLLGTGDRELVEASPADKIWGVGFSAEDAEENRSKWGENRLGRALMTVREQIRKEHG